MRNRYLSGRFILLEGKALAYPSDAYLIPGSMPYEVQRVALKYGLPELSTVNGDLFADLEEGDRVALYSFLKDWIGVREIDAASAAEMLAKRIGLAAPIPSREELVDITRFLKWAMGRGFSPRFPIYVLTKRGEIKPSAEVYLSFEFSPRFDWEKSATADGVPSPTWGPLRERKRFVPGGIYGRASTSATKLLPRWWGILLSDGLSGT